MGVTSGGMYGRIRLVAANAVIQVARIAYNCNMGMFRVDVRISAVTGKNEQIVRAVVRGLALLGSTILIVRGNWCHTSRGKEVRPQRWHRD